MDALRIRWIGNRQSSSTDISCCVRRWVEKRSAAVGKAASWILVQANCQGKELISATLSEWEAWTENWWKPENLN